MKKIVLVLISLLMCFALVGCKKQNKPIFDIETKEPINDISNESDNNTTDENIDVIVSDNWETVGHIYEESNQSIIDETYESEIKNYTAKDLESLLTVLRKSVNNLNPKNISIDNKDSFILYQDGEVLKIYGEANNNSDAEVLGTYCKKYVEECYSGKVSAITNDNLKRILNELLEKTSLESFSTKYVCDRFKVPYTYKHQKYVIDKTLCSYEIEDMSKEEFENLVKEKAEFVYDVSDPETDFGSLSYRLNSKDGSTSVACNYSFNAEGDRQSPRVSIYISVNE